MSNKLKNNAIKALGWSSALQSLSQIFSFFLGIVLARLLTPDDFGLVAMVLVITVFAQLFSDFGLSASIIQKQNLTALHYSSCFWFSGFIGILIMLLVIASSDSIAAFYGRDELIDICLALSVIFFSNSLSSTPRAILTKQLKHKSVSLIDLNTNLLGWLVALLMAWYDFSYWSLVGQQLMTNISKAVLLIYQTRSHITFQFSLLCLRDLFKFSAYVFSTQFLIQIRAQADKVLVGKFVDSVTLGLYTRAYQIMIFPINNISRTINNVMFPTFSQIQDNPERIGKIYLNIISCIAFITFPIMIGLFGVAHYFVETIFGNAWLEMTVFVQFFCIIGVVMSIITVSSSIYLATGNSKLQLQITTITQPIQVIGLFIGIQYGMHGLIASYFITYLFTSYVILKKSLEIISLNFYAAVKAVLVPFLISVTMALVNLCIDIYLLGNYTNSLKLFILVISGTSTYIAINLALKRKEFFKILDILRNRKST